MGEDGDEMGGGEVWVAASQGVLEGSGIEVEGGGVVCSLLEGGAEVPIPATVLRMRVAIRSKSGRWNVFFRGSNGSCPF